MAKNASQPAGPAPDAGASSTGAPPPPGQDAPHPQPQARKGGARPGAGRPPGSGARPASGQPGASGGHAGATGTDGAREWQGGPKTRKKGATAAELDRWAQQVFTWHAMLGRMIAPELALAPEEAKALAESGANLMAEFDFEIGGKTGAVVAAAVTAGAIYVPRYLALMARLEAMRQAEAERRGQHGGGGTQPPPQPAPGVINPDGSPAGGDAAARAAAARQAGANGAGGGHFTMDPGNPLNGQPPVQ